MDYVKGLKRVEVVYTDDGIMSIYKTEQGVHIALPCVDPLDLTYQYIPSPHQICKPPIIPNYLPEPFSVLSI